MTATAAALGFLLVCAGVAFAGNPPVSAPEIDPGSAASAVAVVAGSLLLLAGRRRRG